MGTQKRNSKQHICSNLIIEWAMMWKTLSNVNLRGLRKSYHFLGNEMVKGLLLGAVPNFHLLNH
jgi:hypothetical protein